MNLGKLLSASASFFKGGEKPSYSLSKGGALPKFNEGKNPFGYKASEPLPEPPKVEEKAAPAQKEPPPYAFKPVRAQDNSSPRQAVAAPAEAKPKQGWTTRLNPFRGAERSEERPASAIQTELSLDSVKVVHNDLADADVEVVPVKSRNDLPSAPMLPPARRAWEFMGESLMNG